MRSEGSRSYVYAVEIIEQDIANLLDMMRLAANPESKRRAHITVRGPYDRTLDVDKRKQCDALLTSSQIVIDGVDSFFQSNQNTVFLACDGAVLKQVWDKPGLGFNPHLTVYDGPSRAFAMRLKNTLAGHPLRRIASPTSLREIVVGESVHVDSHASRALSSAHVTRLFQRPLQLAELREMSLDERLDALAKTARALANSG